MLSLTRHASHVEDVSLVSSPFSVSEWKRRGVGEASKPASRPEVRFGARSRRGIPILTLADISQCQARPAERVPMPSSLEQVGGYIRCMIASFP